MSHASVLSDRELVEWILVSWHDATVATSGSPSPPRAANAVLERAAARLFGPVSLHTSGSAVKRCYRQLAIRIHPDKNASTHAAAAFQILQKCYEYASGGAVSEQLQGGFEGVARHDEGRCRSCDSPQEKGRSHTCRNGEGNDTASSSSFSSPPFPSSASLPPSPNSQEFTTSSSSTSRSVSQDDDPQRTNAMRQRDPLQMMPLSTPFSEPSARLEVLAPGGASKPAEASPRPGLFLPEPPNVFCATHPAFPVVGAASRKGRGVVSEGVFAPPLPYFSGAPDDHVDAASAAKEEQLLAPRHAPTILSTEESAPDVKAVETPLFASAPSSSRKLGSREQHDTSRRRPDAGEPQSLRSLRRYRRGLPTLDELLARLDEEGADEDTIESGVDGEGDDARDTRAIHLSSLAFHAPLPFCRSPKGDSRRRADTPEDGSRNTLSYSSVLQTPVPPSKLRSRLNAFTDTDAFRAGGPNAAPCAKPRRLCGEEAPLQGGGSHHLSAFSSAICAEREVLKHAISFSREATMSKRSQRAGKGSTVGSNRKGDDMERCACGKARQGQCFLCE